MRSTRDQKKMLQDATLDGVLHRLGGLVQAVARVRVFEREQVTWNAILSDMLSLSLALKLMGSHVPTSFSASATTPLHCPLDLDDVRQYPELLSTKLDDSVTEEYLNLLKLYAVDPGNEIALQKSGLVSLGEETGLLGHTFELLHHSEDLTKLVDEVDVESMPRAMGEKVHVDRRKVQLKAFDESIDEILSFANGLVQQSNTKADEWRKYEDPLDISQAEQIRQAEEVKTMLKELYRGTQLRFGHKAKQQRREERQSQLAGTKELHLRLNREKKPRKELHFASQRGVVPGYIKSPSFLYRMVRSVGRGSFGDAILIERVDSPGTLYVMKQMDAVRLSAKDKIACFNEIRILASLHHPFVVRYLESFCTEQKVCLVMDYCAGGDLQSFLKDLRKKEALLAPTDVFRLFSQLVLGLKYLHDRRVLHRDLKSQNIFLTDKIDVRIGDLGIAKVLETTRGLAETVIGTPYYLAPEVCNVRFRGPYFFGVCHCFDPRFQHKPYNAKADMWALGCILYELAHGRMAFQGTDLKTLVSNITSGKRGEMPEHYPEDIKKAYGRLLSRDPRKRPSCSELLQLPSVQTALRGMLSANERRMRMTVSIECMPEESAEAKMQKYACRGLFFAKPGVSEDQCLDIIRLETSEGLGFSTDRSMEVLLPNGEAWTEPSSREVPIDIDPSSDKPSEGPSNVESSIDKPSEGPSNVESSKEKPSEGPSNVESSTKKPSEENVPPKVPQSLHSTFSTLRELLLKLRN